MFYFYRSQYRRLKKCVDAIKCITFAFMKVFVCCILLLVVGLESFGQLVRRKDYDAAFALQAGGEMAMLFPGGKKPGLSVCPTGGLKMTFPFTRKWFLGMEINYSQLKYKATYRLSEKAIPGFNGDAEAHWDIRQIQVPVYLKYMLNCNKASVIFGFWGGWYFDRDLRLRSDVFEGVSRESGRSVYDGKEMLDRWNAGITVGYEHQIVKHLDIMFKVTGGFKEVSGDGWNKRIFPLQANLTLSFDILRIGDCGCS